MSTLVVSRNNVVAGIFLVSSVILAVAIAFVLSDVGGKFGSKTEYICRFPTSIGVAGLQPGAEVTFGGLSVGKVRSIHEHSRLDPVTGVEVTESLDVVIAVRSDLVLYENAYADLSLPVLGGVSRINIPSAGGGTYDGGPDDANTVLNPGEVLRGRFAPSILAQLGFSTEEAEALKETIHRVRDISAQADEITQRFARMAATLEPAFGTGVDDGGSAMANIRQFSEKLGDDGAWSQKVGSILTSADEASGKFDAVITDAKATIADARSVIGDSKDTVARILDNVEQTTEKVNTVTVAQIDELLDKGSLALGSYKDLADNANSLVVSSTPKVSATLDSARDIGVQGKLLVEEIRAQPWRVLKKPSREDLEREPIYEAARAYAGAVADLRVASEALDAAVRSAAQTGSPANAAEVARIAGVVQEAYSRYSRAEQGLLERLRTDEPTTTP